MIVVHDHLFSRRKKYERQRIAPQSRRCNDAFFFHQTYSTTTTKSISEKTREVSLCQIWSCSMNSTGQNKTTRQAFGVVCIVNKKYLYIGKQATCNKGTLLLYAACCMAIYILEATEPQCVHILSCYVLEKSAAF